MQKLLLDRQKIHSFSEISNELVYRQNRFSELIRDAFSCEAFEEQIRLKSAFAREKRNVLHQALSEQYARVNLSSEVSERISLLKNTTTFTVTTGHQMNLFTGPAYFVYKILHTIKLAEKLNTAYPDFNFLPVYWMASEDHDFEEINHANLFRQKISWDEFQGGAVGAYGLKNWDELKNRVEAFFTNHPDAPIHDLLAVYHGKNLAEATIRLVHELFKEYPLVIVDGNHRELKREFAPLIKKELESSFSEKKVHEANKLIENLGFTAEVFARPVNLFFLGSNSRERIIPENGKFRIGETALFSTEELLEKLEENPELFSPNVILRPLYQECVLPNLAYIGGGGEMAYWLQFKKMFDEAEVPFPLLEVRNSIQFIDKNSAKKLENLGFTIEELFLDNEKLKKTFLERNLKDELDFSSLERISAQLKDEISRLIDVTDPGLSNFAEAEKTKLGNQTESIRQKLIKQQKSRFDGSLKQIDDLKSKLFPGNGLQERKDNFLNFCPDGDYPKLIRELYEAIDPFEKDLIVLLPE